MTNNDETTDELTGEPTQTQPELPGESQPEAPPDARRLKPLLDSLAEGASIPVRRWPCSVELLQRIGLRVDNDLVSLPESVQLLDAPSIRGQLSGRAQVWLKRLELDRVTGSTNLDLRAQAEAGTVDGCVRLAELQVQGRGRRGRAWLSPFGAGLAMSLGFATSRRAAELGGLSLVVGLAVLDGLERLGGIGLALKWPNDVLAGDAKLGGILIEIVTNADGVQLIVGIGLNVALPPAVQRQLDQTVTDLRRAQVSAHRNSVVAAVLSSVVEFVAVFETQGFAPFREAFSANHRYQDRDCRILLSEDVSVTGRVVGISANGGLLLEGPDGVREHHGGEVSLRPAIS
ncbi:MAG: biotin--[acetyl-CoA-carboxylase] ligase [Pseudomonadales bacterium]